MVTIMPINDHQHYLILDGPNNNNDSAVVFNEEGEPVLLTSSPRVVDIDVGEKNFTSATITVLDGNNNIIIIFMYVFLPFVSSLSSSYS